MSGTMNGALQNVLILDQILRRPDRPILSTFTMAVMAELDRVFNEAPALYLEEAARAAMILPGAQSGGLSVVDAATSVCGTRAVIGRWAKQPESCALLDAVLCPLVLERKALLAFARPERCLPELAAAYPPMVEILMAPFFDGARPAGVVWSVFHQGELPFDRHDAFMVDELGRVLSAVYPRLMSLGLI